MAASLTLCTVGDVRRVIDIADSTLADEYIADASEYLEVNYLRRRFLKAEYTGELLDGQAGSSVWVKNPPVRTLTELSYRVSVRDNWAGVDVADVLFDWRDLQDETQIEALQAEGLIQWHGGGFPRGRQTVQATYGGGLWTSTNAIDETVRRGCALVVAEMINTQRRGGADVDSRTFVQTGETMVFRPMFVSQQARKLLAPWKRLVSAAVL